MERAYLLIASQTLRTSLLLHAYAIRITRPLHVVVDSGRYFHVIVRVPVGTATASQVITGTVQPNCWFE
jgi:hypothetical protein